MNIKSKLTLSALCLAFLPVLVGCLIVGTVATNSGKQALEEQAKRQLTSIRDTTASNIEGYFDTIRAQVQTFSNDRMIIDAMREFKGSFSRAKTQISVTTTQQQSSVERYYREEFARLYREKNLDSSLDIKSLTSSLDADSIALQYQYISANRHPLGEKDALNQAKDGSDYSKHHSFYHKHIRDYLKRFDYYDIFLVDSETGDIIYSVFKELDYSTSLIDGPYANSGIGEAFQKANNLQKAEKVVLTDFAPYTPSYEVPAAFIASPIFDGDEKLGILIFQMPISRINSIMTHDEHWERSGLGKSGETYLIGPDFNMRSTSRFLVENKTGYLQLMKEIGLDASLISNIDKKNTNIGLQPIKTLGTKAALNKQGGFGIFSDYRNIKVLSSYKPLRIDGLDWVIMSEIDEEEAFQTVSNLKSDIVKTTIGTIILALIVGGFLGRLMAINITQPINKLVYMVKDIAEGDGDLTQRIQLKTKDEIHSLAHWFNVFIGNLQELVINLNNSVHELTDSSQSMQEVATNTKRVLDDQHMQTEKMATAITEMTVTVEEVAKNVQETAIQANHTLDITQNGQEVINDCRSAIEALANEIKNASGVIENLHKDSEEIGGMLTVIEGIAEQTNLLALNAAIEAARAGESGRGFAVVADEVRTLAKRTQDSTQQIQTIINRLQSGTQNAVSAMERSQQRSNEGVSKTLLAKESFETIAKSIGGISEITTQIASAAEEQSYTTNEINNNILEITYTSEKNSESAEQVAKSSVSLSELANKIQTMLEGLRA